MLWAMRDETVGGFRVQKKKSSRASSAVSIVDIHMCTLVTVWQTYSQLIASLGPQHTLYAE